jgi:hypothetical protein
MINSRLQIRRVHAQYLLPSDHPAPARVKDYLDEEIKRRLSHALCAAFSSWFSETDSSLWFVRRLEIDLSVNTSGDGEQVARTLSTQLGRALGYTLQEGLDTGHVVRFPNPAAYLARFLSDLAAGDAWGRWYYESFFGLRLLPTSAALRTAICDQAEKGRAALLQLPGEELKSVLRALSRQDARVVLDSLTRGNGDDGTFDRHQLAWSISRLVDADSLSPLDEWGRALYVYLDAARQEGRSGVAATDALLELLRCSSAQLRDVAETIHHLHGALARAERAEPLRRYTECGGAFLLLPLLDELPLVAALRDWPPVDEAAAISLVRFLILIKCGGHRGAERRLGDPVIRDLLLIPPGVSVGALNDWQARVGAEHIEQFLGVLADWQRRQERAVDQPPHEDDLAHLALPECLKFSASLDLALSAAAQHVLRAFACRLPGFTASRLPYLASNFLEFAASIEDEPARRVVRVGSPPLRLVLSMTGMMRQTYRVSWLDQRPLTLFEEP